MHSRISRLQGSVVSRDTGPRDSQRAWPMRAAVPEPTEPEDAGLGIDKSHLRDSNPGPQLYESCALPTELRWQDREEARIQRQVSSSQ